ncbi:MAG: hypothetical protein JWM53_2369 [bacterium]|jgi:hypothetical protein|nr:hypothetical protein [bacterium]
MNRKRVTFLAPHAGIWVHALPEGFLAKSLDAEQFDVSRIHCDGTFGAHCTVMEAAGLDIDADAAQKNSICRGCIGKSAVLRRCYRGRDYLISNYLTDAERAQAHAMVAGLSAPELEKLEYLGVEVGVIAAYETLLKFKKTAWSFSDVELAHLKVYTTNALLSLIAFSHLYDVIKPDILVTYSPQYGVNGVCARYCELGGTKVYFVEGSANLAERYQAVRVWDWTEFGLTNPAMKAWPDADRERLSPDEIARAGAHTRRLTEASSFSVYSEPESRRFDLRSHFGVPTGAKVVLAAMSSYDEAYSAYKIGRFPKNKYVSDVFASQWDWIRESIPFFAAHPQLFFIIRIHPRTMPNKREGVMAPGYEELERLFSDLPANVRVNRPTDKISIYDLYKQIDVLVTGWSACGIEAMTYGVPVVTYDQNLPSYPASIHFTGRSKEAYFANIVAATQAGRSEAIADAATKWMAFSMCRGVVRHPSVLSQEPILASHRWLRLGVAALESLFPRVLHRIEVRRSMRDARRFNRLLSTGAPSLFTIPADPE